MSALVRPNVIPVSMEFKHIFTCSFSSGNCLQGAPKVFHLFIKFSTGSPSLCHNETNFDMLTSRSDEKKIDINASCICSHVLIDPGVKLEYHLNALFVKEDRVNEMIEAQRVPMEECRNLREALATLAHNVVRMATPPMTDNTNEGVQPPEGS
jgi:hypothetical protein